jgi:hypothetical protein
MGKLKTAAEYLTQQVTSDPELKHAQDAERFDREAAEIEASAPAIEAKIRALDYSVETGDTAAPDQVTELENELASINRRAARKHGAAAEARKLATAATRARQEKQFADRIRKCQKDNDASAKIAEEIAKMIVRDVPTWCAPIKKFIASREAINAALPGLTATNFEQRIHVGGALMMGNSILHAIRLEIGRILAENKIRGIVDPPSDDRTLEETVAKAYRATRELLDRATLDDGIPLSRAAKPVEPPVEATVLPDVNTGASTDLTILSPREFLKAQEHGKQMPSVAEGTDFDVHNI